MTRRAKRSFSPARVALATVPFVMLWVLFLMPAPHGREPARRAGCSGNLKQIGYACRLYAEDHGGEFPPSLAATFPKYMPDGGIYICPTVAKYFKPHSESAGGLPRDQSITYCYVAGLRSSDPKEYVLAFEEERNHDLQVVNVLFVANRVERTAVIDSLHEILRKQAEELEAQGRSMKIIRPAWSRWPDRPEYPVRPWYERTVTLILAAVGVVALAGGAAALGVYARRRRARHPPENQT